jgi:hypothetical protein
VDRAGGIESELEAPSPVFALASFVVAVSAVLLAVLPVVIAVRWLELPAGVYGAVLGCLGAAVGGVKLIAMAWAVGGRLSAALPARAAVAATPD